MTGYHGEKMRRVQRKVENLRKAASSLYSIEDCFLLWDNFIQGHKKLDEKDTTYFERKRLQMMRNLQITIRNFHISYETISTTKLGHPFSFGLTISYMEMTVSNDRTNINEENIRLFRLVPINNLLEELKNILWWYSMLE